MRRPPYIGAAVIAAAILIVSVAAFRNYLPYAGTPLKLKEPPAVIASMEDVYLVGLGSSGKLWSLRADRVEIASDRAQASFTDITDGTVFQNGKPVLKVNAGKAEYNTYTRNLSLSGGIRLTGSNGEEITARDARWDAMTSVLTSSGEVRFASRTSELVAQSLRADLANREMTLWNVRLTARLEELKDQPR